MAYWIIFPILFFLSQAPTVFAKDRSALSTVNPNKITLVSLLPNELRRQLDLLNTQAIETCQKKYSEKGINQDVALLDLFNGCVKTLLNAAEVVTWETPVYALPQERSKLLGKIMIQARYTTGPVFFYQSNKSKTPISFSPDFEGSDDWFYNAFRHTALDQKGEWFLLPRKPFETPGWIRLKEEAHQAPLLGSEQIFVGQFTAKNQKTGQERVFRFEDDTGILLLSAQGDTLVVRTEVPSDFSCGAELSEPEKNQRPDFFELPWTEIFDNDGHFKLAGKYPKGC